MNNQYILEHGVRYAYMRFDDINDVVELCKTYTNEANEVFTIQPTVFTKNLQFEVLMQNWTLDKNLCIVARSDSDNRLLGYDIRNRSNFMPYSNDEYAGQAFSHVDLNLPVRKRVRILNKFIDLAEVWAMTNGIPCIVSMSTRGDYQGFAKMHEKKGYVVHGSWAQKRLSPNPPQHEK